MFHFDLRKTIILFSCSFLLFQCNHLDVKPSARIPNRSYIPFAEYNSAGEIKWGYLDENTGEIIIKAKYAFAYPFVGGFAQVGINWSDKMLIDQFDKRVDVEYFDQVYLFTSETGRNTLAVFRETHKKIRFVLGGFGGHTTGFRSENYFKYRMVNLVTGKTVIPSKEYFLVNDTEVIGDYFLVKPYFYELNLYRFLDNGEVELVVRNDPEQAAGILTDYLEGRGINAEVKPDRDRYIKIDYKPYIERVFADSDFTAALQDVVPELTFLKAEPFYRDYREYLNVSLEITEKKYMLYFSIEGNSNHRERSRTRIVGIYNYSKAEWEILPKFTIDYTESEEKEAYYIIGVQQTNNPNLYYIQFTNEEIGWHRKAQMSGGLYSLIEKDYMRDLYLYEDYPPREGVILMPDSSGRQTIKYPNKGVYYRDYGRIKR